MKESIFSVQVIWILDGGIKYYFYGWRRRPMAEESSRVEHRMTRLRISYAAAGQGDLHLPVVTVCGGFFIFSFFE